GEFDKAKNEYDNASRHDPTESDTRFSKDYALAVITNYNSCVSASGASAVLSSISSDPLVKLGECSVYINAKIRNPGMTAKVLSIRGNAFRRSGDLNRALIDLDEAIRLDPLPGLYYRSRADAQFEQGEFQKAIENYTEALQRETDGIGKEYS